MREELSATIIEKYLKGECTDAEIAQVNSWYNSFESNRDDISYVPDDQKEMFRLLMLNNIRGNIIDAGDEINFYPEQKSHKIRTVVYMLSGIAAVLCTIFFVVYYKSNNQQPQANEEIVVHNMTNTIQKITLSDSSKVWLNPKARFSYLKIFGNNSREVSMDGEAFFEVTKDHKRPFSIHSGNVITKVWGTSFRIQSNKGDVTKVDVVTGKVSVSVIGSIIPANKLNTNNKNNNVRQEVMLMPNQEASYNKKSDHLIKNTTIDDPLIGIWKKASLSFDSTPMTDVFQILNKKFNVHIWSDDKRINTDNLKADFTNESFPAIIEMMEKTLNVTYTTNGKEFILKSN